MISNELLLLYSIGGIGDLKVYDYITEQLAVDPELSARFRELAVEEDLDEPISAETLEALDYFFPQMKATRNEEAAGSSHDDAAATDRMRESATQLWKKSFDFRLAAAPTETDSDQCDDGDKFGQIGKNKDFFINCDFDDIPFGLCTLIIKEADGVEIRYFPKLKFIAGRWHFRASPRDIFGRTPHAGMAQVIVVPATRENAESFRTAEIRDFVERLPSGYAEQREGALALLASRGEEI